jgi:hypothetical protein
MKLERTVDSVGNSVGISVAASVGAKVTGGAVGAIVGTDSFGAHAVSKRQHNKSGNKCFIIEVSLGVG